MYKGMKKYLIDQYQIEQEEKINLLNNGCYLRLNNEFMIYADEVKCKFSNTR